MIEKSLDYKYPYHDLSPLTLIGSSIAGVATSFFIKELKVCFDVANGPEHLLTAKHICISHGHLDHYAGLPYILSQKSMTGQQAPNIYLPPGLIEPTRKLLSIFEKIEDHKYQYNLVAAKDKEVFKINNEYSLRPFRTTHRIESSGYSLLRNKKKLKPELTGLGRDEIIAIKQRGEKVEDTISETFLSFTGDTTIDFIDVSPEALSCKNLLIECSFFDEKRSIEETRKWGHIHLDEILENIDKIPAENIYFIHLSKRYSLKMAKEILCKKLNSRGVSPEIRERLKILPQMSTHS